MFPVQIETRQYNNYMYVQWLYEIPIDTRFITPQKGIDYLCYSSILRKIISSMDQIPDIWISGLFAGGECAIVSEERYWMS